VRVLFSVFYYRMRFRTDSIATDFETGQRRRFITLSHANASSTAASLGTGVFVQRAGVRLLLLPRAGTKGWRLSVRCIRGANSLSFRAGRGRCGKLVAGLCRFGLGWGRRGVKGGYRRGYGQVRGGA